MGQLAAFVFSASLLYTGSLALSLACLPLFRNYTLSRVAAPVLFVLVFQALEHLAGFGSLFRISPLLLAVLIYSARKAGIGEEFRKNISTEFAVLAGFCYCLLWRAAFPDLDPSSEKIADLSFICNYIDGARLPPPDKWLPPFTFDYYYSFQHYAAALAGRLLNVKAGAAYHLGYCGFSALIAAAAWGTASSFAGKTAHRVLLTTALFLGGTGAAVLVPFMSHGTPPLHASMRFLGSYASEVPDGTMLGKKIAALSPANPMDLPVEIFSYLIQLGDYHAPLGGFLLLMAALLCMAIVEREIAQERAPPGRLYGIILSTIPLTFITNAWTLPLQTLLVLAWIWYPLRKRELRSDCRPAAIVLAVTMLLLYPFASDLLWNSPPGVSGLRLIPWAERPALSHWLLVFWPVVAMLSIAVSVSMPGQAPRRWAFAWAMVFTFAELFYADDIYSGRFNRFNTYLKWMPWLYNGILLSLGALCLAHAPKIRRRVATAVLILVCWYGVDMGHYWLQTPKASAGKLSGNAWLTSDPAQRAIIEFLSAKPRGVTLEFPEKGGFDRAPALTMAAGQPSFIGWNGHEQLWRGNRHDIQQRYEEARLFYYNNLPSPLRWLESNDIKYIIWLAAQNQDPAFFQQLSAALDGKYLWHETYRVGEFRVGFWERAGQ
ncbi:MAG TPA: DUF2298 domain-containing protein [Elusimicrobiales bacterium]|nr:DUF2298 domain-containing protein [Elusimicrobiales bacterium]